MNVTLTIHGIAKTAGSKRVFHVRRKDGSLVFGKGGIPITNVTDDCKGSKQWRKIVQYQARDQWPHGLAPFDCALEVVFRFFVVRPKAHYRTGKFASTLRDDAPPFPSVKPDVLKLARALEDALVASSALSAPVHKRNEIGRHERSGRPVMSKRTGRSCAGATAA